MTVAPAELEGHLLVHPDVADACVVGIPHEYHGEVPMAFIVLSAEAQNRLKRDPQDEDKVKTLLLKVSLRLLAALSMLRLINLLFSTSLTQRLSTSGWQVASNSSTRYQRTQAGSF